MKIKFPPGELSEEQFHIVTSEGTIRDLPSGLLTCVYHENPKSDLKEDFKHELTVKALTPNAIVLRMMQDTFLDLFGMEEYDGAEKAKLFFSVFYWDLYKHAYEQILIGQEDYQLLGYRKTREYVDLALGILKADVRRTYGDWHGSFLELYRTISKQFNDYAWAASYIGMEDSLELVDGPDFIKNPALYAKDKSYQEFYDRQMEKPGMQALVRWFSKAGEEYEIASSLEDQAMYLQYLKAEQSGEENCLHYDRIYLGNSWCRFQFPSKEILFDILNKAILSHQKVSLVWPLLDADWEEEASQLVMQLTGFLADQENWFRDSFEMVGNDLGMLSLLSELRDKTGSSYVLASGLLLEKRMRDPRMQYTKTDYEILRTNQFQQDRFLDLFERLGVSRFECSPCAYEAEYPGNRNGNVTLHLPLYQTNTGQACPLLALCHYGDRAKQDVIDHCKGECLEYVVTYQAYLDMIGVYNSVFAVDKQLIESPDMWKTFSNKGVSRLVFNLWEDRKRGA